MSVVKMPTPNTLLHAPTQSPSVNHARAERRLDLDWIRIIAFALLIFYHIGMYYVTWDWHVKGLNASELIEPLMQLTSPMILRPHHNVKFAGKLHAAFRRSWF
jgi:hypothetical protein